MTKHLHALHAKNGFYLTAGGMKQVVLRVGFTAYDEKETGEILQEVERRVNSDAENRLYAIGEAMGFSRFGVEASTVPGDMLVQRAKESWQVEHDRERTRQDHAEHLARRTADGFYALHICPECQREAGIELARILYANFVVPGQPCLDEAIVLMRNLLAAVGEIPIEGGDRK